MAEPKIIKPFEDYGHMPDGEIAVRATAVADGMDGNPHFSDPPVAISDLRAGIKILYALIAEALDRSSRVIAEKNRQRDLVIGMLRFLGRYVEVTSDGDMVKFLSSGFEPAPNTKVQQQLSENIWSLDHGPNSGEIVIRIKADPEAFSYELRYGELINSETPETWITGPVTRVKTPITIRGLMPATKYAFQVRRLLESGYTDWSNSVTLICT